MKMNGKYLVHVVLKSRMEVLEVAGYADTLEEVEEVKKEYLEDFDEFGGWYEDEKISKEDIGFVVDELDV